VGATALKKNGITPILEIFVSDSMVKRIWTDIIIVSNIIELFTGNGFFLLCERPNLYHNQNEDKFVAFPQIWKWSDVSVSVMKKLC
jgi:hypothetical protein